MSCASAAAPRAAPGAVAAPARGSAGARNRRAGTEIMSVMLTYLAPIVSAGKTFYRPVCLFVSHREPRKGLQIGQFLPTMGPPARQVGRLRLGHSVCGDPEVWPIQPPITIATAT